MNRSTFFLEYRPKPRFSRWSFCCFDRQRPLRPDERGTPAQSSLERREEAPDIGNMPAAVARHPDVPRSLKWRFDIAFREIYIWSGPPLMAQTCRQSSGVCFTSLVYYQPTKPTPSEGCSGQSASCKERRLSRPTNFVEQSKLPDEIRIRVECDGTQSNAPGSQSQGPTLQPFQR